MIKFTSFSEPLKQLLSTIVNDSSTHAKWINTLSYLENCGARKIAACEHPTLVKEEMLKHAAEEFRHAHHLKKQIQKLSLDSMDNYALRYLLGGMTTLHYLNALDLQTSRYLKGQGCSKNAIKENGYLLVTYAIELRAAELYYIYDEILKKANSKVTVKSILLEEKEHLNEMEEGIRYLQSGLIHAQQVCAFETNLCRQWMTAIQSAISKGGC